LIVILLNCIDGQWPLLLLFRRKNKAFPIAVWAIIFVEMLIP